MSTETTQASQSTFSFVRQYWPAIDAYLKKFGKDTTAKVAQHCARTTSSLLEQSLLYPKQRAFSTPRIKLNVFIDRLLRQTNVPLPTALATLAVISWITKSGLCPLSSSSPHHLFLATLRAVSHFASPDRGCDVDAQWVRYSGGIVRLNEVFLMRMELAELLPTLGERQWALLSNISNENSTVTVNENFHPECSQAQEEPREDDSLEVGRVGSSLWVNSEQDSASDNTHYDSHYLGGWSIQPVPHIHRRDKIATHVRQITLRIAGFTRQTIFSRR